MRVVIKRDYDEISLWAADHIASRMKKAQAGKAFVLGLPTGSTPLGLYRRLVELCAKGEISFRNAITFNMDEYVGLPPEHPQSYHSFMWNNFFSHIDIQKENVHIPNGMADDLKAECASYERKILEAGGIDIFVGGVGSDGHLAFNEPGSSLSSRTREKTLTWETRVANSRFFGDDPEKVPRTALTVGIGTISDAKEVLVLVSGHKKARALRHAVELGVNHMWSISCLQLHRKAIIVCDEDATLELKVGTVKYFKEIEASTSRIR